jgi:hypothetical protein
MCLPPESMGPLMHVRSRSRTRAITRLDVQRCYHTHGDAMASLQSDTVLSLHGLTTLSGHVGVDILYRDCNARERYCARRMPEGRAIHGMLTGSVPDTDMSDCQLLEILDIYMLKSRSTTLP